jgi:hypothetical protein
MKKARILLEGKSTVCPVVWSAVERSGRKSAGNIPQGFQAATRKGVETLIANAEATGSWPKRRLRPARIVDCTAATNAGSRSKEIQE